MSATPPSAEPRPDGDAGPRAGFWSRLARPLPFLLTYKLVFFLAVFLCVQLVPAYFNIYQFNDNFRYPADAPITEWTRLMTWDAMHYLYLSERWYGAGEASASFPPLWPALIRAASVLFAGNHMAAGLVLSNVLSLVALLLFWYLARARGGERQADWSLYLLLAFPGSIFFSLIYTESLFFLLTMLLFVGIERDRWWLSTAAAFLLPMCRAVGILVLLPCGLLGFRGWKSGGRRGWAVALFAAPLAGYATYLLVIYLATGDAFAFHKAQTSFVARPSIARLLELPAFLRSLANVGSVHGLFDSFLDRIWLLAFFATAVAIWRSSRVYFLYALPMAVVPAMTMSFMAFTRYFAIVFPVFMIVGGLLAQERAKLLRMPVLTTLLCIQILFLVRYLNSWWVA